MKKLEWLWDYYVLYHLYNERKLDVYHRWMSKKWGKKYEYNENRNDDC
jgi:hypothetical protein